MASSQGYIDEIVLPDDTRRRFVEALTTLDGMAAPAGIRNIPL